MTRLLSLFGLMRVSEHSAIIRPLGERLFDSEQQRIHWQGECAALRPDAEAMRRKRQMDRDRRRMGK